MKDGLPAPVIGADFEQVRLMDRKDMPDAVRVSCGGFSDTDENLQAVEMDGELECTPQFPYNWMHGAGEEAAPFEMEITCKALLLIFKDSGEVKAGRADVFVDGERKLTAAGFTAMR